ncbi:MAG TPA: DUF454 family protein [Candidatus Merdimorpha stercoravium]|uniref:DUF454 family protein n=1 Tax=Candidatus Merdimorpha stercoravium TaxID=2840863 RepID=A0A9D1H973_9FLAO|nr:DUF454 family protein [Candidatus Merdimorpha stercoravium]
MKRVYVLLGSLSLALGLLGIFLPLLPTTPFLLLTAALWIKGSPRLYQRLLAHKRLGPYIRQFREQRAIPLRAKIVSVSLVWITLGYSAGWLVGNLLLRILLVVLAIGITVHILSYRTLRRGK